MSSNPNEHKIVDDDEPDAANALTLPDCQPETNDDGDNEDGEDSSSSAGTVWSMYVNLSCSSERSSSPILPREDAGPRQEVDNEVEVPSVLSVLNLQPANQAADKTIEKAVDGPEAQVLTTTPRRDEKPPPKPGYSKSQKCVRTTQPYSIPNLRSTSEHIAGREAGLGEVSDTAVANPLGVSAYFHGVSSNLVRNRISRERFLWLRNQINHRIVEALGDPDLVPKSGRSDY